MSTHSSPSPPSPKPSPAIALRPYQAKLVRDLYLKLGQGYRQVAIIAGTGAGKTVIAGKICADAAARGLKLLFLVHLDVLVGQTYQKMQAFGLRCGFIKAGWREDPTAPIQIASIQTMAKRDWWRQWQANVVLFDEGHTTVFSQIGQDIIYDTHPHAVHLALTATPYRLGHDQLGDHMQTLVASPLPFELQRMGYLASMKYFGVSKDGQVDLSNVRMIAGDYDERDLRNACDRPELVDRIVEEYQRLTAGKRGIAFCIDVEHARHVAEAFNRVGIAADVVDGNTPIKDRKRLYTDLASGNLLVLTSCNVISIGFDEPSVEVGMLLRPTQSRALHFQQIGRVMRISPNTGKKHGIILDQAGNLERLGFPEDIREYRLPTKREPGDAPVNPAKQCPDCNRLVWGFIMQCPECGYTWETEVQVHTEDLVEVLSQHQQQLPMIEFFRSQRRKMVQEGTSPNWVKRVFYEKFGSFPEAVWCRGAVYGDEPTSSDKHAYRDYLMQLAQRQGKSISWVIEEFQQEFGADEWQSFFYGRSSH